jgi:hypothetical protein
VDLDDPIPGRDILDFPSHDRPCAENVKLFHRTLLLFLYFGCAGKKEARDVRSVTALCLSGVETREG